jgi:DNA topoisomerase-1
MIFMKNNYKELKHNGPAFVAPYKPRGYKAFGQTLSAECEEMLVAYAKLSHLDHVKDPVFNANFWLDFKPTLPKELRTKTLDDFSNVISSIITDLKIEKEAKAALSKEAKAKVKAEKDALNEKHGFAYVDGQKLPIARWQTEPAGIFIGRGAHPLKGRWKRAIRPEDVTIFCTGKAPEPPAGHKWKEIKHSRNTWNAWYFGTEIGDLDSAKAARICGEPLQKSTSEKFDKAQKMNQIWKDLTKHIEKGVKDGREEALIAWIIQQTAMRVGNERDTSKEADVQGASTLKVKNVTFKLT